MSLLPDLEFGSLDLASADAFLQSLPTRSRVYVYEWVDREWRFVFGDDRDRVFHGLSWVRPGARFRLKQALVV